ncbi:MAG: hypothetical protein WCG06_05795 [Candidatus Omnitrophota bacterium]
MFKFTQFSESRRKRFSAYQKPLLTTRKQIFDWILRVNLLFSKPSLFRGKYMRISIILRQIALPAVVAFLTFYSYAIFAADTAQKVSAQASALTNRDRLLAEITEDLNSFGGEETAKDMGLTASVVNGKTQYTLADKVLADLDEDTLESLQRQSSYKAEQAFMKEMAAQDELRKEINAMQRTRRRVMDEQK